MKPINKIASAVVRFAALLLIFTLLAGPNQLHSQSLETFEERVTEFTLDNGLHFIIIERDVAPVASFLTMVNVGSANEPIGKTGITHIFEHMAFKGTHTIGTSDIEAELPVLEELDEAYKTWHAESIKANPNRELLDELWAEFEETQEEAKQFVVNNEFSEIINREGAVGMNAYVNTDETAFFYSLPQNKAELWFKLEADRFMNPVMREFYEEKNVIWEERRDRTDNSPIGRLLEEFNSIAFSAHPYKNQPIGWPSDIDAVTIEDTINFYETYYVPQNMVMAVAGDVDPEQMRAYAEKYFGNMQAQPDPPQLTVEEPEQRGERRFTIEDQSQPILMIGYKGVAGTHEDAPALDLLASTLFQGRTSRMYRSLVVDEQLALQVQGFSGYPGDRFPGLFLMFGVPNQDVETADLEQRIYEIIEDVKENGVSEEELDRVRRQARASTIRGLTNNSNLTLSFARQHHRTGDWRNVFRDLDRLAEVTPEDVQRVAQEYLIKQTRTVGQIVNEQEPTASADTAD